MVSGMIGGPEGAQGQFASWERDPDVVFILDRELRIVFCNAAWDRFARENDGESLLRPAPYGNSVLDAVPERLKRLYASAYRQVLMTCKDWEHHYECSSPQVYRMFRMTVQLDRTASFLVVRNSLIEKRAK